MLTVKGITNIDDNLNSFDDVYNIYNYYDFRSIILDYNYAFNVNNSFCLFIRRTKYEFYLRFHEVFIVQEYHLQVTYWDCNDNFNLMKR
jgi:hypothetical protein